MGNTRILPCFDGQSLRSFLNLFCQSDRNQSPVITGVLKIKIRRNALLLCKANISDSNLVFAIGSQSQQAVPIRFCGRFDDGVGLYWRAEMVCMLIFSEVGGVKSATTVGNWRRWPRRIEQTNQLAGNAPVINLTLARARKATQTLHEEPARFRAQRRPSVPQEL